MSNVCAVERRNLVQAAQTHHKSCLTQGNNTPTYSLAIAEWEQ